MEPLKLLFRFFVSGPSVSTWTRWFIERIQNSTAKRKSLLAFDTDNSSFPTLPSRNVRIFLLCFFPIIRSDTARRRVGQRSSGKCLFAGCVLNHLYSFRSLWAYNSTVTAGANDSDESLHSNAPCTVDVFHSDLSFFLSLRYPCKGCPRAADYLVRSRALSTCAVQTNRDALDRTQPDFTTFIVFRYLIRFINHSPPPGPEKFSILFMKHKCIIIFDFFFYIQ